MDEIKVVIWSLESSNRIEEIKDFIRIKWTEKEVNLFIQDLKKFESIVKKFPYAYPSSPSVPEIRRAVISKHNSVVYQIDDNTVRVLTVFDNLKDNE
ncbi:MAG: type II toxin-antitoxin system RelE/ParE family toxin [Imperialibacter sp.]|uniref:type II toxin-antitoxin system RelE/ParE family toxin n=1 Tax=Imperialibacter sp. TaxID=2038411 RepID=UPI003A836742